MLHLILFIDETDEVFEMEQNAGVSGNCRADLVRSVNFRTGLSWFVTIVLVMATLTSGHVEAAQIDLETRAELQFTLKQYIDTGTVDGVYEHFNVEQGKLEKLRLKTLHPVIFVTDGKYMMCADFLDTSGKEVMLDYVVGPSATGFRIEQEIPGRRSYLKQIFERIE
jgi:hypothetical protein